MVMMLSMLPTAVLAEGIDEAAPPSEPTEETVALPAEEPSEESPEEPTPEPPVGDTEENSGSAPVFQFDSYQTLEDFGISTPAPFSLRATAPSSGYLNPQTIRPTSGYYGHQWICNRTGYVYPFTASFTLDADYMPQNSVYIAIANYDCDEIGNSYSCEYDQVYVNGHCIGVLTGNNATSNTTLLKVDRSYLKAGINDITIRVGIKIKDSGYWYFGDTPGTVYADDPYNQWWLRVDDIQILCDGGSVEGRPDLFRVNLTNAEVTGNQVNCYVTTQVEDSQNRTFSLEYALYDWSSEESATYGQIIADCFATISSSNYAHKGTLTMPVDSLSGTYTAVVYLKTRENGQDTILAYDEESFEYETGIAPAFDIQNLTAVPATMDWTTGPIAINISADIDVNAGLSDLEFCISDVAKASASVDEKGHITGKLFLTQNGFYTVELRYIKNGTPYKKTTTVEINNLLSSSDGFILKAGLYTSEYYKTGNRVGYSGTYTFWTTTAIETEEVYVYCNGQPLQGGKPLTVDASEIQKDNTRLYKIRLKLGEGLYAISFRSKDGSSEATTTFCSINDTADVTRYAADQRIDLKTWPSIYSQAVGRLPANAAVTVCGEIDVSRNEGYDFICCNGVYYFVKKGLLSDTPAKGGITEANEQDFREFVKTVSKTYYQTSYDFQKYYYLASEVKKEWDQGGFLGSRQDNAYSTAQKGSEYNIQMIQAMLLDGIQQKADSAQSIDLSNYTEGMGLNPLTGAWEVNDRAVVSQQQYNHDLTMAMEEAENALTATVINTIADVGVIYFTKGKADNSVFTIFDAITSVVEDGLQAYSKAMHQNETAMLKNYYRDLMKQAILDMYDDIDQQMSADYRKLYAELCAKGDKNLSEDEKLMKSQLEKLIKALDTAKAKLPDASSEEIQQLCDEAAEALVEEIGLEETPYLSDGQIAGYIAGKIVSSLLFNAADAALDIAMDKLNIDNAMLNHLKSAVKDALEVGFEDMLVKDLNMDGCWDTKELTTAIVEELCNGMDHLEEIIVKACEPIAKEHLTPERLKNALAGTTDKITNLKSEKDQYKAEIDQRKAAGKNTKHLEKHNQKLDKKIKNAQKEQAKIQAEIDQNNGLVMVLVEDLVQLVSDTFTMASTSVGIGDMADNEVLYAYIANYMVHAMEAAQIRRATLDMGGNYYILRDPEKIDQASVTALMDFVNRVYGVYEQDMLGHSAYTSLAAGWHYSDSGEKLQDWMDEYYADKQKFVDDNGLLMYSLFSGYFALYKTVAFTGGISQAEYLEKLNAKQEKVAKDGLWQGFAFYSNDAGILEVSRSELIYDQIAQFANKVEVPDEFRMYN